MTVERIRVGLDLDDLLLDLMTKLCAWHNRHYGTTNVRNDLTTYDIWQVWRVSLEEGLRRVNEFYTSEEHASMQPVQGAERVVPILMERADVVVVSARPEHARPMTLGLLEEHYPDLVDHLHLTNQYGPGKKRTKSDVCKELALDAFADDAPHHHADVAKVVPRTILFETPWNREYALHLPRAQRARSWYGLALRLL